MADISNLTGLEKPLLKLFETMSEAIGVMGNDIFEFDAKKIKRIGEAEAEVEKQKIIKKAEGQGDALDILHRAGSRFALEQYNRQINLENIIVKSQEYLQGRAVSNEPVDKDWTLKFIQVAQEVSKEEVQDLLARILAGEVRRPNTYSLRTLEVLKNLGKNEIEIFNKFVGLSTEDGFFHLRDSTGVAEKLKKYGLSFYDFLCLADVGLFNPSSSLSRTFSIRPDSNVLLYRNVAMGIVPTKDDKDTLGLGILKFTDVGSQLYRLLVDTAENDKQEDYFNDLKEHIESKGFTVTILN